MGRHTTFSTVTNAITPMEDHSSTRYILIYFVVIVATVGIKILIDTNLEFHGLVKLVSLLFGIGIGIYLIFSTVKAFMQMKPFSKLFSIWFILLILLYPVANWLYHNVNETLGTIVNYLLGLFSTGFVVGFYQFVIKEEWGYEIKITKRESKKSE